LLCGTIEDANPVNGLYTLRSSDGGGLERITFLPGCLRRQPCIEDAPRGYSPDGSRILFNRQERSTHLGHLFVVNPDGTGLLQLSPRGLLTPDADPGGVPADWSPDGSRVVFGAFWKLSTGRGSGSALFVMNADGSGLHRITPFGIGALSARWSPDGRLIAFNSKGRSRSQIWVVRPDGNGLRELTQPTHGDFSFAPVWSPDSTALLFQAVHPEISGGHEDLWIVYADGTGLFQLTDTPDNENTPSWGSAPVG
jgi:TolB protein